MTQSSLQQPPRYHITMYSFDGVHTAAEVVKRIRGEDGFEGCEVEAEALVSHHADGRVELHERGGAAVGATFGAVTAGIIGLVTGPVFLLLMIAAGGIAGGLAGHFAGQILQEDDLKEVGESLPPDSSAFLAIVDTNHAAALSNLFAAEGARVLDLPVETELSSAIREAITHHVVRV